MRHACHMKAPFAFANYTARLEPNFLRRQWMLSIQLSGKGLWIGGRIEAESDDVMAMKEIVTIFRLTDGI
jgi:hypothetical protein